MCDKGKSTRFNFVPALVVDPVLGEVGQDVHDKPVSFPIDVGVSGQCVEIGASAAHEEHVIKLSGEQSVGVSQRRVLFGGPLDLVSFAHCSWVNPDVDSRQAALLRSRNGRCLRDASAGHGF